MLEKVVWPRVKSVRTRRIHFFKQDGATARTTLPVREFGERIISRHTNIPWPSRSHDLSPLDLWMWSVSLAVEEYTSNLNTREVIEACRDVLTRAKACIQSNGGAFQHKLKKFKRKNEE